MTPSGDRRSPIRVSPYGPWFGITALLAWMRWPEPWILAAAAAAVLLPHLIRTPPAGADDGGGSGRRDVLRTVGGRAAAAATVLLLLSVILGFVAQRGLQRIGSEWDDVWAERESATATALGRELDRRVDAGLALVEDLADGRFRSAVEPGTLRLLRERYGIESAAVFDDRGELQVWDGEHRGSIPAEVRTGAVPFAFEDRPLFSYLYFTRLLPSTGGTAVAALLLDASLPPGIRGSVESVLGVMESRTGVDLVVSRPERVVGDAVWDFRWEDEILFSVSVAEPLQADARESFLTFWQRWVLGVLAVAWLVLTLSWRGRPVGRILSIGALGVAALLLPFGRLLGSEELASPTSFLLAPPLDGTYLRTLAVTVAALAAFSVIRSGPWRLRRMDGKVLDPASAARRGSPGSVRPARSRSARSRWGLLRGLVGGGLVAVGFPLAVWAVSSAGSTSFLAGSETAFVLIQLLLSLVLVLLALPAVELLGPAEVEARSGTRVAAAGLAAAFLLSVLVSAWVAGTAAVPAVLAALWIGPVVLVARGGPGLLRRWGSPALWVCAGAVAISCALPFAWEARLEARIEIGETRLDRLGSTADPYTEYLLQRFSDAVDSLDAVGAEPVELLYGAWVSSGMAGEGIPAWITRWSPGDIPLEELRIGLPPPRPTAADEFLAEARLSAATVVRRLRRPDARYVVVVPLISGATVTAVVPPASAAPAPSGAEPLFGAGTALGRDAIEVVPLLPEDPVVDAESTRWTRTAEGWRGERSLELLDGPYHVHYTIELPRTAILAARGSLLFALDLGILGLLLGGGVLLFPARAAPVRRVRAWLGTFQGRVTVALFAFFLLSVALLGGVGYRTLAGASSRTAQALADRAADEAAAGFLEVQGSMDLLARRVGADLLRYVDGRLVDGSTAETFELGLYEGWIPFPVHQAMANREALEGTAEGSIGTWGYVVSYHRMPDGSVLGAPVSLEAGEAALRRREMMDLLGFALLIGGVLSLGLAVLVGRTLVRPLRELSHATGRVGLGDLSARLPDDRSDEFGAVFDDFNRMVARLREARRDLVRTERILAWGEMARQVAHEVKNPLTPIKLSVQHIRRAWEDQHAEFPDILKRNVEATLKEIDRLDAIARSFSRFGTPGAAASAPLEPTDVGAVVSETLDLYSSNEGPILFEGEVSAGLPAVSARPDELKEVLVNVLENARTAIRGQGVVRVEAEMSGRGGDGGRGVELRVTDDGPGIPPELLPRVFEPRFSTRSAGTGLGLAIVRRIVESWGGRVHARSRPGEGATIVIELSPWSADDPIGSGDVGGVSTP